MYNNVNIKKTTCHCQSFILEGILRRGRDRVTFNKVAITHIREIMYYTYQCVPNPSLFHNLLCTKNNFVFPSPLAPGHCWIEINNYLENYKNSSLTKLVYYSEDRALVQDKSHNASRNLEEIT